MIDPKSVGRAWEVGREGRSARARVTRADPDDALKAIAAFPVHRFLATAFCRTLKPTEEPRTQTAWLKTVAESVLGETVGVHVWIQQRAINVALRQLGFTIATRRGHAHVNATLGGAYSPAERRAFQRGSWPHLEREP